MVDPDGAESAVWAGLPLRRGAGAVSWSAAVNRGNGAASGDGTAGNATGVSSISRSSCDAGGGGDFAVRDATASAAALATSRVAAPSLRPPSANADPTRVSPLPVARPVRAKAGPRTSPVARADSTVAKATPREAFASARVACAALRPSSIFATASPMPPSFQADRTAADPSAIPCETRSIKPSGPGAAWVMGIGRASSSSAVRCAERIGGTGSSARSIIGVARVGSGAGRWAAPALPPLRSHGW